MKTMLLSRKMAVSFCFAAGAAIVALLGQVMPAYRAAAAWQ
jgi:hypothetical protein